MYDSEKKKLGFTLIELLAVIVVIVVVLAITIPIVSNIIETVRREAFKATAYSISDSGRFLMAHKDEIEYEEFYYLDGVQYNATDLKLDYSGDGPKTGVVILNENNKVAMAIHNGTYCATKSADTNKVNIDKTAPDDCTAYNIINTCDTWEQIALKYDINLDDLLRENNVTDPNTSTCDLNIKLPLTASLSNNNYASDGEKRIYYKTYYSVGYTTYSEDFTTTSYEYTIKLGVLPLNLSDIEAVRVTTQSVFESLDDFKRYITKKNMGEVIWPGDENPTEIDIDQASVFRDHALRTTNMNADDVTVMCDTEACYATIAITVNNMNNVSPNTINNVSIAYLPVKFTVEFNGEADTCTVRSTTDAVPGTLAGLGTSADPYLVESIEDLVALSNNVNVGTTYSGKYIFFTNSFDFKNKRSYEDFSTTTYGDINGNGIVEELYTELTTGAGFKPIGNNTYKFSGIIKGNGNCVYNLYVNRPTTSYVGFIGYNNNGDITALTFSDTSIVGWDYTGGVTGYNYNGNITEIGLYGNVTGNNYTGLISGYFQSSDQSNKVSSIMVEGNVTGANYVGGFIGKGQAYYGTNIISGIYKGGTVISIGTSVGRIAGNYTNDSRGVHQVGALSMDSITVNGSTVSSTSTTGTQGSNIADLNYVFSDINLVEIALDTYIGGDNDGNGLYWDYDMKGHVVRKNISKEPISFSLVGSGTSVDPFLINNYDDLRQASLRPYSFYVLTTDIDLSGKNFYMLGSFMNRFTGNFNGNIKTISNIDIDALSGEYVGFSGYISGGTITAANIQNINIESGNFTGGIAGYNYNGSITEINLDGNVLGGNYTALIAGYFQSSDKSNRLSSIMVEGNVTGENYVGGFVGRGQAYYGTNIISGIYKGGTVISTGTSVGRIAGNYTNDSRGGHLVGALSMDSITINGSTITSTSTTGTQGSDIADLNYVFSDINLVENVLDTYIGGDNDGNGFYWDYDATNKVVRKTVADYPLNFTLAGAGTSADPYLIGTYEDLRQASLKLGSTYKLMSNLDLYNKKFYMMGSYVNPFTGTFNGNAKTISNLTIDSPHASYVGFTGYDRGTISALNLDNVNIMGSNYTAGLAGYISNGRVIENSVKGNITGNTYVALGSGYLYNTGSARLSSIIIEGNVTGTNYVAGLVAASLSESGGRGYITGIYKGGSIVSTGSNVARMHTGSSSCCGYTPIMVSTIAMNNITVNGSTITSTYPTGTHGADFDNISDLDDINLVELALDTYIGGDNDGNGYYWDYDASNSVVLKNVADVPLAFNLSGAGTSADPYLISSYEDLRQATLKLNSIYKLTTNLNLYDKKHYMLGSYLNNFTGQLYGETKTISNITIDSPHTSYLGFSGYNTGTITLLNLDNINVTGSNYTGALAGYMTNGKIIECTVKGNVTGNNYVSFGAGHIYNTASARIASVIVEGNLTGVSYVGGIAGFSSSNSMSNGYISGVYKGGSIVATGSNVGRIHNGTDYCCGYSGFTTSGIAMKSITINGVPITNTYPTSGHGADFDSLADLNNINLVELALDTYIGGDNDGNGYYWDYDGSNNVVLKNVADVPLAFNLSGAGTIADPYLISSYEDLRQATLKLGSVYKLITNLDLTTANYYTLGSYLNNFTGTLNGDNKTINNITIDSPHASYIGFSGYNRGTITGLNLNNINVNASNYTGALAGYMTNGKIIECTVKGNVTGNNYVSFGAGHIYNTASARIASVIVEGNLTGVSYVGGIAGYSSSNSMSNGYISGIYKGGSIIATGSHVGRIHNGTDYCCGYSGFTTSGIAMKSITINGTPVTNTYPTSGHGADFDSLADLNNINLVELALDTYINGDDDGNGYYWDYDVSNNVILKNVANVPLSFNLSGAGTSADPYIINTYEDLRQTTLKLGSYYKLNTDIDLSGSNFYIIGSYLHPFTGKIDGNVKKISNLTIDSHHASYIGFSGYNRGTIIGLTLDNVNVNASNYAGGLAGYMTNGQIKDSIVNGNVTGYNNVGLGIGHIYNTASAKMASVIATGNVTGNNYIGGLLGYSSSNSLSNGNVSGIFAGGSITSIGTRVGRIHNGTDYCCGYSGFTFNASALVSTTVNGSTVTSTSASSGHGLDITSSDLSNISTYTNRGFNFTDETLDYIWYIDGSTAKFRAGSL